MTITDIIRNEVELALDHNPSREELAIMVEYIYDGIADKENEGKKVYLADIEERIRLCRDENFRQCEECGEWFLLEEMHESGYKCLNCQPYSDPDAWKDEQF